MTPPVTPDAHPAPRRRSHAERSARTRQQVLDAAATLVREGGMQAASMFEVAKAAGVTPGALQHHFGSKAELMMQVLQRQIEGSDDNSDGDSHGDRDAHNQGARNHTGLVWPAATQPLPRRAEAWVRTLWASFYEPPRFLTAWGIYFGSCSDPALRERIVGLRKGVSARLMRRFIDTFPELAGRRETPAFFALVLASLRGLAMLRLFDPSPTASLPARRALVRLITQHCRDAAGTSRDVKPAALSAGSASAADSSHAVLSTPIPTRRRPLS